MRTQNNNRKLIFRIFAIILLFSLANIYEVEGTDEEFVSIDMPLYFVPSGWMGDGEYGRKYIDFNGAYGQDSHTPPTSIKINYTFGPKRWAGIYWQNRPDNWGDQPGYNYSKREYKKITFWAKGATGREVVEFKAGGIMSPGKEYIDSFEVSTGRVFLEKEWKQYSMVLEQKDLSSVIGGFCWLSSVDYNDHHSITFYLDDICFE
ncbi:MAG: hypothetical protein GY797_40285 [Deltaproteobacteria bacterium]|nr:hypothetical protein [Deltaproteobacteria bacterium]MCP4989070.1 hypothetical protein [Colwellia sp.]